MCRGFRSEIVDRGAGGSFDISGEARIQRGVANDALDVRRRKVLLPGRDRHKLGDLPPSHRHPHRLARFDLAQHGTDVVTQLALWNLSIRTHNFYKGSS